MPVFFQRGPTPPIITSHIRFCPCKTISVIGGEQNVITRKNEHKCKTCIKESEN